MRIGIIGAGMIGSTLAEVWQLRQLFRLGAGA
jgi:predicted dinucleotide-binding enzyme